MAKRKKKPANGGVAGDVAESVGASLGTFVNQVEAQVRTARAQRDAAIKGLLSVRDRATALLAELGHAVSEIPLPRKRAKPQKKGAVATAVSAVTGKFKRSAPGRQTKTQRTRWALMKAKKSGK